GEVRLRLRADAGCLAVDVEDAGPGVPTELRERVFEPFFTTRREGHGLGLAVVRQIARAHGGGVRVAEAAGGGARFTLLLPTEAPA
ncbi:MAG: ATP-binding protein, partial [Myxococcales bacterium]|nr:ATP-binding protein [Myxococcales bacterium]